MEVATLFLEENRTFELPVTGLVTRALYVHTLLCALAAVPWHCLLP